MRWLSTTSALLFCYAGLSTADKAEPVRFDRLGNMIWDSVVTTTPSLTRPDFSNVLSLDHLEHAFSEIKAESVNALKDVQAHLHDVLGASLDQLESLAHLTADQVQDAKKTISKDFKTVKDKTTKWINEGLVLVDGVEYERLVHPAFSNYSLRLSTSSKALCDPEVVQHSGYLDIGDDKHLWFIFYESRNDPSNDPVLLWLNGGPGCSSSTGLLFELGPCSIANGGESVERNPHSWTNHANMIFLDQPVEVGYSYTEGDSVNTTPQAAKDVYAFLQLFMKKFPEYSSLPLSVAAESYGGHYAPHIASEIFQGNEKLSRSRYAAGTAPVHLNLDTVMLGNGLTSPLEQFGSVKEFGCAGDFPLFEADSPTCQSLEAKTGTCTSLIKSCQKYNSRFTCLPAALYCWSSLYGPAQQSGKNLYDVRKSCDRDPSKDGPLCYKQMEWIDVYMNKPEVKKAFGVSDSIEFQSCNMNVNQAFMMQGDSMHDSSLLLPELVQSGVRLLVYAGEADFMCNALGNSRWIANLATDFQAEFNNATLDTWYVPASNGSLSGDKQVGGWVRKAGKGAGSVAFVKVKGAGHMVPYDQPEAAADLVTRWLANKPLA